MQDSIDVHDLSTLELVRLWRNAVHEINIRIDGLTPGGDDEAHRDYHVRALESEVVAKQISIEMWAKLRAGGLFAVGAVLALALIYLLSKAIKL
jgi:hypothetical protein